MKNIAKSVHLAWRIVGGRAFVINTKTSTLHEFDGLATFIWKEIDAGTTRDDLLRSIVDNYEVSAERASADLDRFLQTLQDHGIIGGI
jgi:hypothetical protein